MSADKTSVLWRPNGYDSATSLIAALQLAVKMTVYRAGSASKKPRTPAILPVPADSGSGMRVVYGLGARHVWLVNSAGKLTRGFDVMPSTVNPPAGSYKVYSRAGSVTGSDGVQIEHVVRFTSVDDVTIGFSAAVNGSMPSPDPDRKTGGVRMKPADGNAMWPFATIGTKVVVVP